MFVVQAATHLKGLAEKAKLNEKHVRIARIYKAKVATLTSERAECNICLKKWKCLSRT